jgi:hypothetical protein
MGDINVAKGVDNVRTNLELAIKKDTSTVWIGALPEGTVCGESQ